jgi:hypothetical protein
MNTIVAFHHPSKNKNLWVVSILENDSVRKYCKSAYSAMRYMFLLQSSSADFYISDNCLQRLSFEIALNKRELACRIRQHALNIACVYDMNGVLAAREP